MGGNTTRSTSPAARSNSPNSPYGMPPLRSSTSPLPSFSASHALSSPQGSAFPSFAMARSQSSTPSTPLDSSFNFSADPGTPQDSTHTASSYTPSSLQTNSTGHLMQRMDRIDPRPFNVKANEEFKPSSHKKSPSMGSSRDFVAVSKATSPKTHVQRPSTSSSNYTRNPSFSSISTGPRSPMDLDKTRVPDVPSIPRPSFQDQSDGSAHIPLPSFDFGSFRRENPSRVPPKTDPSPAPPESRPTIDRIHSESSSHSHKPRPSVAVAAMQPLYEIGSTSSFKPSRSVRSRAVSPAVEKTSETPSVNTQTNTLRDDRRLGNAPPVPLPSQATEALRRDNAFHKLNESTSSNESYSSDVKSGSSFSTPHESTSSNGSYGFGMSDDRTRASPQLNASSKKQNTLASSENQASDMFKGFVFDVEQPTRFEEPIPIPDEQTAGYVQPSRINAPAPVRPMKHNFAQNGDLQDIRNNSPTTSPDEYILPSFALGLNNLRMSPAPTAHSRYPESTLRRPMPAHKGNCRGCGDLIHGKSVSSADGRLTGRYHKQCFMCRTCQQPFRTADFYVMNNQPYCARHYHELNDSLCTNCDRGIEGQYLETELRQKFHPYCFSCQDCHIILRDDYYEFNGKTLCEQHAFGAAYTSTPSSLGPGRRYPERRTTRLMMM